MLKKTVNTIKVLTSLVLEKKLNTGPILLEIEPVNYCNLDCLMCPNREMLRKKGYMDYELFKKIVDQTAGNALEYSFGVQGEPTLHHNLTDMIGYVKEKGAKVSLNSNMNFRNEELPEQLVKMGVDRIVVTISGLDEAMYKTVNRHGNLQLLLANVKKIQKIKKYLNKKSPAMIASFAKMKINSEQAVRAEKELTKYFDYCHIIKTHDWVGNKRIAALKPRHEILKPTKKCSFLWTTVTVLWDGRLAACCHDYEGRVIHGDANSEKIEHIWNNRVHDFRQTYKNCALCLQCPNEMRTQFSIENIFYTLKTLF